jgi:small subunit ribosomal protein S18
MSEDQNKLMAADPMKMDKDADSAKARPRRKRKISYLTLNKVEVVDYKDTVLLRKFINDRGKMIPSRQSGTTARQQREVAKAIKRAREMALIPFVVAEMSTEKREPREPREYREGGREGGYRENRETREPRAEPTAEVATAEAGE